VLYAVYPGAKEEQVKEQEQKKQQIAPAQKVKESSRHSVPVKGLIKGMAIHYARCCHPLPGDRIVGIVTTGRGVTIHTINCSTLEDFADSPERWLDVSWDTNAEEPQAFMGRVHAVLANEPGSLGTISSVIGRSGGNIFNLKVINRGEDFYEMLLDIEVTGVRQLSNIMAALRATPVVNSVDRAFS